MGSLKGADYIVFGFWLSQVVNLLIVMLVRIYCMRDKRFFFEDVTYEDRGNLNYGCTHDSLTGLFSRRHYFERLAHDRNFGVKTVGVILVDINGLKDINESYSQQIGDQCIIRVAKNVSSLIKRFGKYDTVRIGGDEFLVYLPNVCEEMTKCIVQDLTTELAEAFQDDVSMSVTVAYTFTDDELYDPDVLLINVENQMIYQKMINPRSSIYGKVHSLMCVLYEKSNRVNAHSEKVGLIAKEIAIALNLPTAQVDRISAAAKLHDIGKVVIDSSILNKPSSLDEIEYLEMKKHVDSSYKILESINICDEVLESVYTHHEKWDGTGYPRGVKDIEIPLGGRIISVADAYEAMRSNRPYQKAMSHEDAVEELIKCSGKHFDPVVVGVFLSCCDRKVINHYDFGFEQEVFSYKTVLEFVRG